MYSGALLAQPSGDPSWDPNPIFFDDFTTTGRSWDGNWFDAPQYKWRGHMVATGSYHGRGFEWQVFQKQMLQFKPADGVLRIASSIEDGPMGCSDYEVPPGYTCDPDFPNLYCYSGAMEALNPGEFLYGYFEIRCKLPVHRGAFPAFWLYKESDGEYREIDIFEYSWNIEGDARTTTRQIYYKKVDEPATKTYAKVLYTVPDMQDDLSAWHTFALDWSPGRVVFYVDGKATNSYTGPGVPDKPMGLIVNYSIDNFIGRRDEFNEDIQYFDPPEDFPSEMIVDYVLVKKYRSQCTADVSITGQNELNLFDGSFYRSVQINGFNQPISFSSYPNSIVRGATILVEANTEFPLGKEVELVTHACHN